jgi:hypothetical protein
LQRMFPVKIAITKVYIVHEFLGITFLTKGGARSA